MNLRDYQHRMVDGLRERIRAGKKKIVLKAPTGSGKTNIGAEMTKAARDKGKRVCFLADRIELIDQTSARFDKESIDHGVIQGDHWRWRPHERVQIATVQTLVNREFDPFDLMFVDEAHGGGDRLNKFVAAQAARGTIVIGLTATPFTRGMGKHWDDIVCGATTQQLIDLGFLVPPIVYAPSEPDLTGVTVDRNGEWNEDELAARMNVIVGDIVQTWVTRGQNRQTICFAVNVAHSKHLVEQFLAAGIAAEHIDGYMGERERRQIVERFRYGETKIISNVGILDRGFDVPETSCVIYARPIRNSLSLYIQMGGRGLRPYPGKTDCLILDHSGNTIRHGFLTDPTPEKLDDGKPKKKKPAKPKEREPKKCPSCAYVKQPGEHKCPACGFEPEIPNVIFADAGTLQKLTKTEDKKRLYSEIKWVQRDRGYSEGWAAYTFKKFTGKWPRGMDDVHPIPPSDYTRRRIKQLLIAYHHAKKKGETRAAA